MNTVRIAPVSVLVTVTSAPGIVPPLESRTTPDNCDPAIACAEAVLKRSLPALVKGAVRFKPNDLSHGSYYGRRRPDDGRIDWSKSAQEIHNLVRAVAPPFPGAFCDRLQINRTQLTDRSAAGRPLGPYREGAEWFALCGDGKVLRLVEVEDSFSKKQ